MIYIYIILHGHEKRCPAIYNYMGENGEHYDKWNKPDRERKTSFNIAYTWNLKKKQKRQTHRMMLTKG